MKGVTVELSEPITDVKDVTPELLTERLARNGFLASGRVTGVEKTDSFGSSAAKWDRLTVTYSEDTQDPPPDRLVLKVYRKGWFGGGLVEWTFYDELAPNTPGSSVCPVYDCGIDRESRDCHFIMPDLSVTHGDPPKANEDRPFEAVVREFTKYHTAWWGHERLDEWPFLVSPGGPLRMAAAIAPEDVRKNAASFTKALKEYVDKAEDPVDPDQVARVERVIERYPEVFVERIGDRNGITMLHGDAHLWNLYYPKDASKDSLILFDWETFKRGLAPYDLAYLLVHGTSGRKEIESRLMDFYYGLLTESVSGYGREQFEYDFRLSVVACVFCPLIWKRKFSWDMAMQAYEDWNGDEIL